MRRFGGCLRRADLERTGYWVSVRVAGPGGAFASLAGYFFGAERRWGADKRQTMGGFWSRNSIDTHGLSVRQQVFIAINLKEEVR